MTIAPNLLLALLSMDSYNEGYGAGVVLPGVQQGGTLSALGDADIVFDSAVLDTNGQTNVAKNAGFYAIAYKLDGTIVIAYRGADNLTGSNSAAGGSDFTNGYGLGAGSGTATQALMAAQFYQAVAAANPGTTIQVAGHSLGGGLAGYVGALGETWR